MDTDVIIIGGGLNGPALALALAGLRVVIVDARPAPARSAKGFDGRAYSLAAASQRLLSGIGVWHRLADHAQPIVQIKACDGAVGRGPAPFFLNFDARELDAGPMGYMVEDRHLYTAFLDAMQGRVSLVSDQKVIAQHITAQAAGITLDDGRSITARLIVGADGRGSGTAERAGIPRIGWDYGQTALVSAVRHDRPHNGIAHQYFMPAGPLAILPLAGGHHSQIVWSETSARATAIAGLNDADYLAGLRPRFGDFLGEISLSGPRYSYPLSLSLANDLVRPRLALVGDAAHGVHPIAGQGLNLGLRDVAALAEVIVLAHRRGEDIGALDVLERYARWRRFDNTAMALGIDGVNRLFSNDNPLLRGLRDLGMGLISATPALRRGFMRQAAGLSGNLPKLLQGKPI